MISAECSVEVSKDCCLGVRSLTSGFFHLGKVEVRCPPTHTEALTSEEEPQLCPMGVPEAGTVSLVLPGPGNLQSLPAVGWEETTTARGRSRKHLQPHSLPRAPSTGTASQGVAGVVGRASQSAGSPLVCNWRRPLCVLQPPYTPATPLPNAKPKTFVF